MDQHTSLISLQLSCVDGDVCSEETQKPVLVNIIWKEKKQPPILCTKAEE